MTRNARWLGGAMLVLAALAATGPMAHVLELPNKLQLEGPSWLMVQQHLYRGWGAVFGPIETAAMAVALALAYVARRDGAVARPVLAAAATFAAMVVVFFIFNLPVNTAFAAWTP